MEVESYIQNGAFEIATGDGCILFTRWSVTVCNDWRETPFGLHNFGWRRDGAREEWIRYPCGREERRNHMAHVMSLHKVEKRRLGWLRKLFDRNENNR